MQNAINDEHLHLVQNTLATINRQTANRATIMLTRPQGFSNAGMKVIVNKKVSFP